MSTSEKIFVMMTKTCGKKAGNGAVCGKTGRACDSCMSKRARWYCAADEAFLCQACDSSVHSANQLAQRHERVRLKMASSWHEGFAKKARTPRRHGRQRSTFHLVPEVVSDDTLNSREESNGEQLIFRVPVIEPFVAELCTTARSSVSESRALFGYNNIHEGLEMDGLHGFLPSEIELAEFAADVESLLGKGLDDQCMGMDELGLVDSIEEGSSNWSLDEDSSNWRVKAEDAAEKPEVEEDQVDMGRESFQLTFDYDDDDDESPAVCEEVEDKALLAFETNDAMNGGEFKEKCTQSNRKMLLQLDYEAVITSWTSQKSPWTNGDKPELRQGQWWPHDMGTCGILELHQPNGEFGGLLGGIPAMADGGREARVSRYREKRRTRLFSKKIRYEVRRLNAEKRPRMKGRFVKRASFAAPPPTFPLINK